jgi:hypothetical protein
MITDDSPNREIQVINLDAVRIIDQVSHGHIRLWFSETHTMEINGTGAKEIFERIAERAQSASGDAIDLSDPMDRLMSKLVS